MRGLLGDGRDEAASLPARRLAGKSAPAKMRLPCRAARLRHITDAAYRCKRLDANNAYRAENRDYCNERERRRRAEQRDAINAKRRERYAADAERRRTEARERRAANKAAQDAAVEC